MTERYQPVIIGITTVTITVIRLIGEELQFIHKRKLLNKNEVTFQLDTQSK